MTLESIADDCGCTSVVADHMTLAPQQHTQLHITFNPHGYAGAVTRKVLIVSDDDQNPFLTLPIRFDVHCAAHLEKSVVQLPESEFPRDTTASLDLLRDPKFISNGTITFEGVPTWMHVSHTTWTERTDYDVTTITVSTDGTCAPGRYEATIYVEVGDEKLPLQILHIVHPLLRALPGAILVQNGSGTATLEGLPVEFLTVSTKFNRATIDIKPLGKGSYTLHAQPRAQESVPDGAYDLAELTYKAETLDRVESLEVPIRIVPASE